MDNFLAVAILFLFTLFFFGKSFKQPQLQMKLCANANTTLNIQELLLLTDKTLNEIPHDGTKRYHSIYLYLEDGVFIPENSHIILKQ